MGKSLSEAFLSVTVYFKQRPSLVIFDHTMVRFYRATHLASPKQQNIIVTPTELPAFADALVAQGYEQQRVGARRVFVAPESNFVDINEVGEAVGRMVLV